MNDTAILRLIEAAREEGRAELSDAQRDIGIYRDRMEAACAEHDQVKQRLWREVDGPGSVMGAWQSRAQKAESRADNLLHALTAAETQHRQNAAEIKRLQGWLRDARAERDDFNAEASKLFRGRRVLMARVVEAERHSLHRNYTDGAEVAAALRAEDEADRTRLNFLEGVRGDYFVTDRRIDCCRVFMDFGDRQGDTVREAIDKAMEAGKP